MTDALAAAAGRIEALQRSIARLEAVAGPRRGPAPDEPVFVAGIGWRCGSTLVQRMLMTDPSILVWGEPMDRLMYASRLRETLLGVTESWPEPYHWIDDKGDIDLARDWVANMAPDPSHLQSGFRGFFDNWLGAPARERGFGRWGVKQVLWHGDDGVFLRWLYPRSRFVVIVRHPVSCYHSLRQFGLTPGQVGYWARWPDRAVIDAESYARLWNDLAVSWIAASHKTPVSVVRYEDLVEGRASMNDLGPELGLDLHAETALAVKVGDRPYTHAVAAEERDQINALTAAGRALFGYAE